MIYLILFFLGFVSAQAATPASLPAPLFKQIGHLDYPIQTKEKLAQVYFNQGLTLFYGFEWGEAIRSFKAATSLDPSCAMCHWGVALGLIYKINAPVAEEALTDAKQEILRAKTLAKGASAKERDLIQVLSTRLENTQRLAQEKLAFTCHASKNTDKAPVYRYIDDMRRLTQKYPEDNQIKILYSTAIFWNMSHTEPIEAPLVKAAIDTLTGVLQKNPLEIGANHYYIHFLEPYAHPKKALSSAIRFETLVPQSEHLRHMPSHIYFLTGRYQKATTANLNAIQVFKNYNTDCRRQGFEPEVNFLYFHNYDFLRSVLVVQGRKTFALSTVKEMQLSPFPEWLKNAAELQWFIPILWYVEAQFAMWDDILKEKMPLQKYRYALGMWHYTRGLALTHQKKYSAARQALDHLHQIIQQGTPQTLLGSQGKTLLEIAREFLAASLDSKLNFKDNALKHLLIAQKLEKSLGYHEPPDWYYPINLALGDFYLRWRQPIQAIAMYRLVLSKYPNHPWALFGLAQSLSMDGQSAAAKKVMLAYQQEWKQADIAKPVESF